MISPDDDTTLINNSSLVFALQLRSGFIHVTELRQYSRNKIAEAPKQQQGLNHILLVYEFDVLSTVLCPMYHIAN